MKLRCKYCLTGTILIILLILVRNRYFNLVTKNHSKHQTENDKIFNETVHSKGEITLVIRYNRDLSKQLTITTVNSFLSVFPSLPVIIVSDSVIPREIFKGFSNTSTIINIPLKLDLLNLVVDRNVVNYVKTKYAFFAPPGVISFSRDESYNLIKTLNRDEKTLIAVPVKTEIVKCLKLELNLLQWFMLYKLNNDNHSECDSIKGSHGIFMHSKTLQKIGEPFLLPFPEALYIQTTSLNLKVKLCHEVSLKMKEKNYQKVDLTYKNQLQRQIMNKQFKIKKVILEDGTIEWFGCTRNTPRCFPSVVNSIPEYLNQGRWTPPCCLKILRETVQHVFKVLKDCNVTFWLEGGSLLGAVRMKDIIPWDYDVDIGVYLQDIDKCPWLRMVHLGKSKRNKLPSVVDRDGFLWEKASPEEGDFYRVQASVHNHLHVDIFPFFSRNGIMTKKTWFPNHPQDMEFSENYLKPLTTLEFVGIEAPAPNNVKEFLELKFGKGCVENPQYPNSELFPFPAKAKKLVVNETYSLT